MTLRTKLLGAGAALLLSTGAALAVPATAQTDLNVRSGPGTQYPVVGSIQGGETVDAGACTGGWCRVSFSGGSGLASRSYLAMGGAVAPGPAVAVSPYVYDDDYYEKMFAALRPVLERRLSEAISATAGAIIGAWEAAGKPQVPLDPPTPPQRKRRPA